MVTSDVQPLNTSDPRSVTDDGRTISFKSAQSSKAPEPMDFRELGNSTSFRFVHDLNKSLEIFDTDLGISMDFNDTQCSKAPLPKLFRPLVRVTSLRLVQSLNASLLISFTDPGTVISFKLLQLSKALVPISVTREGITTVSMEPHLAKVLLGIFCRLSGRFTCSKFLHP